MVTAALVVLLVALLLLAVGAVCWVASGDCFAFLWIIQGGPELLFKLIIAVIEAISDANS